MLEYLAHDTGLWVAISFVLFVLLAYKFGKNAVLSGLDKKIADIKNEIETAERLRVEAQELLAQYQRKQRDAEKEAAEILKDAEIKADNIRKKAEQDLAEIMDRREIQLAERMRRLEENAIAEIKAQASDLAIEATRDVILRTLDEKSNKSLTQSVIQDISKLN